MILLKAPDNVNVIKLLMAFHSAAAPLQDLSFISSSEIQTSWS